MLFNETICLLFLYYYCSKTHGFKSEKIFRYSIKVSTIKVISIAHTEEIFSRQFIPPR